MLGRLPLTISFCHFFEGISAEPVGCPIFHRLRTQGKVEINAWPVPVQAAPFQTAAAPFHGCGRQFFQNCFSIAFSPMFRENKEILEIDSGSSEEGRDCLLYTSDAADEL